MNTPANITAAVAQPFLLAHLVEKLAQRNNRPAPAERLQTGKWWSVTTSSVEAFLEGSLDFEEGNAACHSAFTTPFLFTCVGPVANRHQLTWAVSLN